MSNYSTLKAAIQSAVYTNNNNEITGAGLQAVLLQIVNTVGDGYVFKGVATAGTTPGTPDANVYYIAPAGTYTNFGSSYTVPVGSIGIFSYNGSWNKSAVQVVNPAESPLTGYYECDTAGNLSAKAVSASGYVLPVSGGAVKIKMANRNTSSYASLNINGTGAKLLYYNGKEVTQYNTWNDGDILEVFYDPSAHGGSGGYMASDLYINDRLEFGLSLYNNFSVDLSSFPNVVLTTTAGANYIYSGKRKITYIANMGAASLQKNVVGNVWSTWIIVYEPTANIYNIYTGTEVNAGSVPNDAVTLAVCRYNKLIYTATDFVYDGNTTGLMQSTSELRGEIAGLKNLQGALEGGLERLFEGSRSVVYTNWEGVGYVNTSGSIVSSNNARYQRIDGIAMFKHISIRTSLNNLGYVIAFFDSSGQLLSNISVLGSGYKTYEVDMSGSAYESASYAIVSCYDLSLIPTAYCELSDGAASIRQNDRQDLGITRFAKPIYDYNVVLVYGQSLAAGQQTCPPLSIVNYKGNKMIGYEWVTGNSIVDMYARCPNYTQQEAEAAQISDQERAESPAINLCNALKYMIDDACLNIVDRKVLVVNAAIGGQSIELLSKNCPNNAGADYASMVTKLTKAKNLSDAAGKTSGVVGVIWMQGEWNGRSYADQGWTAGTNATNDKDDYKALLIGGTTSDSVSHNGMLPDIISDVKSIFGQSEAPVCICTQTGIGTNLSIDMPIDMALLEASDEFSGLFMACSPYSVPNRGVHLDPNGSRWVGEFLAKAYYNIVFKNLDFKPLRPVSISRFDDYVHIVFNNKSPLQFDTSILTKKTDYGFEVYCDGVQKTINAVLVNDDSVDIYVSGGTYGRMEVTYAGMNVDYGNLRDSDGWRPFEKYKELPSQLKPAYEPHLAGKSNLYNNDYPMFNFSVKWYYEIGNGVYKITTL